jgi:hypothetical protein
VLLIGFHWRLEVDAIQLAKAAKCRDVFRYPGASADDAFDRQSFMRLSIERPSRVCYEEVFACVVYVGDGDFLRIERRTIENRSDTAGGALGRWTTRSRYRECGDSHRSRAGSDGVFQKGEFSLQQELDFDREQGTRLLDRTFVVRSIANAVDNVINDSSTMLTFEPTAEVNGTRTQAAQRANKIGYFFQYVLPAIENHWLRDSIASTHLECMDDSLDEFEALGCGHLAFAALAGIRVREVEIFFPQSGDRVWVNRIEMERALRQFGWQFKKTASRWPNIGLCLIHWYGPWTSRGYAHGILQRTHWVAVLGNYVFDANWHGWLPKENWEDVVVAELLQNQDKAQGWIPLTGYELCVSGMDKAA